MDNVIKFPTSKERERKRKQESVDRVFTALDALAAQERKRKQEELRKRDNEKVKSNYRLI